MLHRSVFIWLVAFSFFTACSPQATEPPVIVTVAPASSTPEPSPTPIPATATPEPVFLDATVWETEPRLPILLYHYFVPDSFTGIDPTQIRLGDFRQHLESIYQAGYTLVSIEDWLEGNMSAPAGRKPVAMTWDDVFVPNQLEFDASGNPSPDTGLGVLWQFSQEHPDFGFEVALFANFGDKTYGVTSLEERKAKQARAVVWCMEHGARIYNHTFSHIDLALSTPEQFASDLALHDTYLRELLSMSGRQDLIPQLGNMLAVPYSWPADEAGYDVFENYVTPEGLRMQAVFGSSYFAHAAAMPAPYTVGFDPFNIKRFEVNADALAYLVRNKAGIPAAQTCRLGPLDGNLAASLDYLSSQILQAVVSGACPPGIYVASSRVFNVADGSITYLFP